MNKQNQSMVGKLDLEQARADQEIDDIKDQLALDLVPVEDQLARNNRRLLELTELLDGSVRRYFDSLPPESQDSVRDSIRLRAKKDE